MQKMVWQAQIAPQTTEIQIDDSSIIWLIRSFPKKWLNSDWLIGWMFCEWRTRATTRTSSEQLVNMINWPTPLHCFPQKCGRTIVAVRVVAETLTLHIFWSSLTLDWLTLPGTAETLRATDWLAGHLPTPPTLDTPDKLDKVGGCLQWL